MSSGDFGSGRLRVEGSKSSIKIFLRGQSDRGREGRPTVVAGDLEGLVIKCGGRVIATDIPSGNINEHHYCSHTDSRRIFLIILGKQYACFWLHV